MLSTPLNVNLAFQPGLNILFSASCSINKYLSGLRILNESMETFEMSNVTVCIHFHFYNYGVVSTVS